MGVTYIDPAAGALADSIKNFGQGLAANANQKKLRFEAIRSNPAQAQAIAAAFRRAGTPENQAAMANGLGVELNDLQTLSAGFQPTIAERTDIEAGKVGLPELQVGAAAGEAKVSKETSDQTIAKDVIGRQLDGALKKILLEGREIDAALVRNLPEEMADTQLGAAKAQQAENAFTGSVFRRRSAAGLDRITVDLETLKARADTAGIQLKETTTKAFKDYFDSLDPGSHAYKAALLAAENPGELAHMQFHESLDASESIELAKLRQGSVGDALAATKSVSEETQKAVEYLRLVRDEKDADQDVLNAAISNVQNWESISQYLQEEGIIFPGGTIGAEAGRSLTGKPKGAELVPSTVQSSRVRGMLEKIVSGEATVDMLSLPGPDGKSAMDLLLPIERRELAQTLPTVQQKMTERSAGDARAEVTGRGNAARLPSAAVIQGRIDTLTSLIENKKKESPSTGMRGGFTVSASTQAQIDSLQTQLDQAIEQLKIVQGLTSGGQK